ncbi:MAG: tetratricopeptide repeat protein [Acidobacteria bacterium]|nr:tetratricopeptide repeat protein [Acidobacteriota bacterium]
MTQASVFLKKVGDEKPLESKTDSGGNFIFSSLPVGSYLAWAQTSDHARGPAQSVALVTAGSVRVDLVLASSGETGSGGTSGRGAETMPLDDKTEFEVAGVTDWTGAGGHGSDNNLRTSENLARDTRALENRPGDQFASTPNFAETEKSLRAALARSPNDFALNHQLGELYLDAGRERDAVPLLQAAYRANPSDYGNGYDLAHAYEAAGDLEGARDLVRRMLQNGGHAELHGLLAEVDEQMKDPLSAVREYERATQIQPSEGNYFRWAVELLIHRAVQPAVKVFTQGAETYPRSERMLEGLGAALYASGSEQNAAEKLCQASDLNAQDPSPYMFLMKMEQSAVQPLVCAEERLARFARDHPANAAAQYGYAIALRKREEAAGKLATAKEIESLLNLAIADDQHFARAYLELGVVDSARGDLKAAITQYHKALVEDPNLTEAHFRLAQAYKRVGEQEKAREQFQAYERTSKSEAAAVEARRREVRQFVIVLKQQPNRPSALEP